MPAGEGRHLREVSSEDDFTAHVTEMIEREREVRDEALAFCETLEAIPLEGDEADDVRTALWQRAAQLRTFIAEQEQFLSDLPSPGTLYNLITERLDDPDCVADAQEIALVAQSAAACLEAVAAQVRLLTEMRRRGLPV
ncbi:MAG TPA: hypothetical protein VK506_00845 [Conexibacter sp.]|nr:hypothetical protein [Conexibacter sp.]